jgi:hypothetical protein
MSRTLPWTAPVCDGPRRVRSAQVRPRFGAPGRGRTFPTDGPRHNPGMIILGIVLLILGFVLKIAILWTIGIIVAVIGLVLLLAGVLGSGVAGRRHYW